MIHLARALAVLAGTSALAAALSACGPGYQDLPLPGSGVSGPTYTIEAKFDDALNLSRGAQVKVNGLLVGRVQKVTAEGYHAVAELKLKKSVALRSGSTARLRYDTPLGELFIQLNPSAQGAPLTAGSVLTPASTETAPTVEDTLAEASLLINGGGLDQLQTITTELNNALGGNEATMRSALDRAHVFVRGANSSAQEFGGVLQGLRDASASLLARREVFRAALKQLGPAALVLHADTEPLVRLLAKGDRLAQRVNHMLGVTRTAFRTTLVQLGPILDQILSTKSAFVAGLSDIVAADQRLKLAVPGDFMPLNATIELDLSGLLGTGSTGGSGTASPPGLPGLPNLLGLLGGGSTSTGGGSAPPSLPSLPPLPSLSGLLGLGRTAAAPEGGRR